MLFKIRSEWNVEIWIDPAKIVSLDERNVHMQDHAGPLSLAPGECRRILAYLEKHDADDR